MLGDITQTELHEAYCIDETRSFSSYADQPGQLYQVITSLRNDVAEQVAIKYRNAMEKYIPLMFINRGLPWNPFAGNIFATYIHSAVPIALVNLALWNDYRKRQNIDIAFLQKTIYLIERQLKHTTSIYQRLNTDSSLLEMNRFPEFYLEIA
jgi:hypothetical protein